jgi:hypothetical protein
VLGSIEIVSIIEVQRQHQDVATKRQKERDFPSGRQLYASLLLSCSCKHISLFSPPFLAEQITNLGGHLSFCSLRMHCKYLMRSVGEWKANWSVAFYRGDIALFLLLMLRRCGGEGEVKSGYVEFWSDERDGWIAKLRDILCINKSL